MNALNDLECLKDVSYKMVVMLKVNNVNHIALKL
jgi:hypothetical protein